MNGRHALDRRDRSADALWLALGTVLAVAAAVGGAAYVELGDRRDAGATSHAPYGPRSDPGPLHGKPRCTVYVAPGGRASVTGRSRRSPTSLAGAERRTRAGSVVCLKRGTYRLRSTLHVRRSGMPGRPIVYRSRSGRARDVLLKWQGPSSSRFPVQIHGDAHHVEIAAVTIDGVNVAAQGVKLNTGAHHVTIRSTIIRNTGSAGIGTKRNDYVTAVGNFIHHTGYDPRRGWSSGISYNMFRWSDGSPGFHSYIVGNIISGSTDESSYHSDGNGIIVDRTVRSQGDAPPVLISNNVVFANGSNCIKVLQASHVWAVNNTCYKNALDRRQHLSGEVTVFGAQARDVHLINNVAYAWSGRSAFAQRRGAQAAYVGNVAFGGALDDAPSVGPADLRRADPRFRRPPHVDAVRDQQQRAALPPWFVGRGLAPRADSPLVDTGTDPFTVPGVTPDLLTGLRGFLGTDVVGNARPRRAGWDVGAYEVR